MVSKMDSQEAVYLYNGVAEQFQRKPYNSFDLHCLLRVHDNILELTDAPEMRCDLTHTQTSTVTLLSHTCGPQCINE